MVGAVDGGPGASTDGHEFGEAAGQRGDGVWRRDTVAPAERRHDPESGTRRAGSLRAVVSSARVHTELRGARPVALAAVTVGVLVAVALGVLSGFRAAGYVLAGVLLAVALARAVLPVHVVGALAVRSRALDVATTSTLAVALAVLARTAPG